MIDLRSDTVTKPTQEMRSAMAAAEVGDDVYGEDPTVNLLQERAKKIFEKEAALFVPTGSMGNQIAVKIHTDPGQEVIIEERGHIFNYEMGSTALISGVTMRPVKSVRGSGHLTWDEIAGAISVKQAYYDSPTGLICLENTHNLAGGTVMTAEHCANICEKAHELGLPVHMDGARIFNASVASRSPVADLVWHCDSVQFCLSKGLGAPVGSILMGTKDFIEEARIWRKRLGGGMRQAGILAAAGLIALEKSPARLHEDHEKALKLVRGIANLPGISINFDIAATNIVNFNIAGTGKSSDEICAGLEKGGVLAFGFGNSIRMVTHCDISVADIDETIEVMAGLLE